MLPRVSIVGKKTSIPSIMENGVNTNTILLETLDFIKKVSFMCLTFTYSFNHFVFFFPLHIIL